MGTRGPVPKRADQRRRVNKPAQPVKKAPAKRASKRSKKAESPGVPAVQEDWHPIARRWFESLAVSGQSVWYTASDWATAVVLAEALSRELNPKPMIFGDELIHVPAPVKAAALATFLAGCSRLLVTEGDRRRLQVELEQPGDGEEKPQGVARIDEYRRRLESG